MVGQAPSRYLSLANVVLCLGLLLPSGSDELKSWQECGINGYKVEGNASLCAFLALQGSVLFRRLLKNKLLCCMKAPIAQHQLVQAPARSSAELRQQFLAVR